MAPKDEIELEESKKKKELEQLLALKKEQERLGVLNETQMRQLMSLERQHKEYMTLDAAQMEEQLKNPLKKFSIKSEEEDEIIAAYKALYSKESWYKEPETKNGRTILPFPNNEAAVSFFTDQAKANRKFVMLDENDKVLGYSNGDGTLYHSDGRPLLPKDELKAGMELKDFTMPQMAHRSSMGR